jgi:hypothetical protein
MKAMPLSVVSVAIPAEVVAALPAWNRAEAAWCPAVPGSKAFTACAMG